MIQVGIAGLGFMGMVHYLSYQKLRGVKVAAICSDMPERLAGDWRGIQGNFGPPGQRMDLGDIARYDSLADMLADPQLDLIDITLPPSLHADIAVNALKQGKHVFSEKPMALTIRDCQRMTKAAANAQRHLLVGHVLPYFPEYAWALKVIGSGKYGKLRGGNFRRVIADPAWLTNYWTDAVGGPMLDLYIHDAHFIRYLFGAPTAVNTQGRLRGDLAEYWNTQYRFADADLAVAATSGTIVSPGKSFDHGFEIHLEKAVLQFQFAVMGDKGQYFCPPTILEATGKIKTPTLSDGDPMNAFQAELRDVVRFLAGGPTATMPPALDPHIAADAITLCHKQTQSLRTGKPVAVPV